MDCDSSIRELLGSEKVARQIDSGDKRWFDEELEDEDER
jgi:hypothetical protein